MPFVGGAQDGNLRGVVAKSASQPPALRRPVCRCANLGNFRDQVEVYRLQLEGDKGLDIHGEMVAPLGARLLENSG